MSSSGGGKVRAKRWNREKGKKRRMAVGCGKFEYGVYLFLPLSPSLSVFLFLFSLFAETGEQERTGCEGRMRFVIGATSAVCRMALMFAPFVLSPFSIPLLLSPIFSVLPYTICISIDSENRCFSLITLFLFLYSLSFHLTTFAYISLVFFSTLFLYHLHLLLFCLTDSLLPTVLYPFLHPLYCICCFQTVTFISCAYVPT